MKVNLDHGVYVLAISGGVDSAVLLHMLHQLPKTESKDYKFIVAHFDHGIRGDSKTDRQLVQELAKNYSLPFVYHEGHLGPGASEALARDARYNFLHKVRQAAGAQAIVTAHHQDDVIETLLLNLVRGSGRKCFSSLRSTDIIKRPLLHLPKLDLIKYAQDNQLIWHEDSTNSDQRYLRNRVRHRIVPRMTVIQRKKLVELISDTQQLNRDIDQGLETILHLQPAINRLDRQAFIMLPHNVGLELLATWLRNQGDRGFDKPTLQRLSLAAKTFKPGQKADISGGHVLLIGRTNLTIKLTTGRPNRAISV